MVQCLFLHSALRESSPSADEVMGEQNLTADEYNSMGKQLRPRTLSVSPSLQQQQLVQPGTPSLRPNNSFTAADFEHYNSNFKGDRERNNKKKENNQVDRSFDVVVAAVAIVKAVVTEGAFYSVVKL